MYSLPLVGLDIWNENFDLLYQVITMKNNCNKFIWYNTKIHTYVLDRTNTQEEKGGKWERGEGEETGGQWEKGEG